MKFSPSEVYYPEFCGTCKFFVMCGERSDDEYGRQPGKCLKYKIKVTQMDWCHDKNEQELHEAAMAVYGEKSKLINQAIVLRRRIKRGCV